MPLATSLYRRDEPVRHINIDPDWLDFGPEDPLESERWINACIACGSEPALAFVDLRWQVQCPCGIAGSPAQLAAIVLLRRAEAHDALRSHGVLVLDVTCAQLPAALVEKYLSVKRDGLL